MKCDICEKNVGNVYYIYFNRENGVEMIVCEECIKNKDKVVDKWAKISG